MCLRNSQYLEALSLVKPSQNLPDSDQAVAISNQVYSQFLAQHGFRDASESDRHYLRMAQAALQANDFTNCKEFLSHIQIDCEIKIHKQVKNLERDLYSKEAKF
jgi:hypothetical protein